MLHYIFISSFHFSKIDKKKKIWKNGHLAYFIIVNTFCHRYTHLRCEIKKLACKHIYFLIYSYLHVYVLLECIISFKAKLLMIEPIQCTAQELPLFLISVMQLSHHFNLLLFTTLYLGDVYTYFYLNMLYEELFSLVFAIYI